MTATSILAASMAGLFVLLAIVTWQLVVTLKQARRAVLAMEEFLLSARPTIETVAHQLGSVLARADRMMTAAEEAQGRLASLVSIVGPAISVFNTAVQAFSLLAALISGLEKLWKNLAAAEAPASAEPATGGTGHE